MTNVASRSPCVIGNLLDIVGDRWTLLLVRDLLFFGKHEYKDFLSSPEGIATNILSDRLKRLLSSGIIEESLHPTNKSRKLYYLTAKGKALLPILIEMLRWGSVYFPASGSMKPVFDRVERDPKAFKAETLKALDKWERENLA
jgi:DNA-binding HxlR family transcriptional regulator